MKFVRICLSLILIFCITWGFLIFAGPILIKQWSKFYFNNQVELKNINVSSRLDVSVEQVSFNFRDTGYPEVSGHARAIKFDWSIFGGKITTTFNLGPTNIVNYGSAKSLELRLDSKLGFGLIEPKTVLTILDLNIPKIAKAKKLIMSGKVDDGLSQISDVSLQVDEILFLENVSLKVPNLVGELDRLDFFVPVNEQNGRMKLFFDNARILQMDLQLENAELLLSQQSGGLSFQGSVETASSPKYSSIFTSLEFLGDVKLRQNDTEFETNFKMGKFEYLKKNIALSALQVSVAGDSDAIDISTLGSIDRLEIWNKSYYIGKIDGAKFEKTIRFAKLEKPNRIFGNIEIVKNLDTEITANASLAFKTKSSLENCLNGICPVGQVELDYNITANEENLKGLATCMADICRSETFNHSVSTSNTSAFFEASGRTGVFSPIFLLMAFNTVSQGERIGMGHELNF